MLFTMFVLFLFGWLFVHSIGLALHLTWCAAKVIAALLIAVALPVLLVWERANAADRKLLQGLVEAWQAGALPVTLGPRIFRTEPAGLAALVMVWPLRGDYE